MRGNPLLRTALLGLALCLAGLLVAAVVGHDAPARSVELAPPPPAPKSTLVPTLLTITLSAPARSVAITESSGRTITIPADGALSLEHETELSITDSSWEAQLTIAWQDLSHHNFVRLDFEPELLKSTSLTLDFRPHASQKTITTNFDPGR